MLVMLLNRNIIDDSNFCNSQGKRMWNVIQTEETFQRVFSSHSLNVVKLEPSQHFHQEDEEFQFGQFDSRTSSLSSSKI